MDNLFNTLMKISLFILVLHIMTLLNMHIAILVSCREKKCRFQTLIFVNEEMKTFTVDVSQKSPFKLRY